MREGKRMREGKGRGKEKGKKERGKDLKLKALSKFSNNLSNSGANTPEGHTDSHVV